MAQKSISGSAESDLIEEIVENGKTPSPEVEKCGDTGLMGFTCYREKGHSGRHAGIGVSKAAERYGYYLWDGPEFPLPVDQTTKASYEMEKASKSVLDGRPVKETGFPLVSQLEASDTGYPLVIVGCCKRCGAPIYGPERVAANAQPIAKFSCPCAIMCQMGMQTK